MIRSTIKILTGSGFAIIVGLLTLPFLTRIYSPESFGSLQLFQTIILYGVVFSSFRYEVALLTVDEHELENMKLLCFVLNIVALIATLLVCIIIFLTGIAANHIQVLAWMPLAILVSGMGQIFSYLGQRNREYSLLSKSKVIQAIVNSACSALLGLIGFKTVGLIVSDLLGRLAYALRMNELRPQKLKNDYKYYIAELKKLLIKYKELPMLAIPGGFINVIGGTLTSVMMYTVFDARIAGQYFLAEKVAILPFGLIAASVSQVYSSEFALKLRTDKAMVRTFYWSVITRMGMLGVIPALLTFLLSDELFLILFGQEWKLAADIARIMSLLMLSNLMVTPVNMTIMILGNQGMQLIWESTRLIIMLIVWYVIYYLSMEPFAAVQMHVFISILIGILFVIMADLEIKKLRVNASN